MQTSGELINAQQLFRDIGIEQGMHLADLGCGNNGAFLFIASRLVGDSGRVYAVDIMKPVLERMRSIAQAEHAGNVMTVWSDLEIFGATKIPQNSLDRALLINVLFQSKKKGSIIKEAARLLKHGGRLLVVDWKKSAAPLGPALTSRVDREELIDIAKASGFELLNEFEAGKYHFALIFVK